MSDGKSRDASINHVEQQIERCERMLSQPLDPETMERLETYLSELKASRDGLASRKSR